MDPSYTCGVKQRQDHYIYTDLGVRVGETHTVPHRDGFLQILRHKSWSSFFIGGLVLEVAEELSLEADQITLHMAP